MLLLNNLKIPIPDLGTMGHGDDGVNTSGYSIPSEIYMWRLVRAFLLL